MNELTRQAAQTLYEGTLKLKLEEAFLALMGEVKEMPDGIYGQYATTALKNLVQLSANGIADINTLIMEGLSDSHVFYANYEDALLKIKELDTLAAEKEKERNRHYEAYSRKLVEYEKLRNDYYDEKGIFSDKGLKEADGDGTAD